MRNNFSDITLDLINIEIKDEVAARSANEVITGHGLAGTIKKGWKFFIISGFL